MYKISLGGILGVTLLTALYLLTSCDFQALEVGPVQTKQETVALAAADEVDAEIVLGAGRLEISGGADSLLEAEFLYNVTGWEPAVEYMIQDRSGQLIVRQFTAQPRIPLAVDDVKYQWNLRFNEDVPLNMFITMGAGSGELELDQLLINSLEFRGGAGDIEIDLSGSTLSDLDVRMGAGSLNLDLTGDWRQNMAGQIKGGVGITTVYLPSNVGVRVLAQGRLGSVKAIGLQHNGDIYTNEAYGQSDITLDIDIETGIGEITLQAR